MITNPTRRCNNSHNSVNNNKTTRLFMEVSAEVEAGLRQAPTATASAVVANVSEAEAVDLPAEKTILPVAIDIIPRPPQQPITTAAAHRQQQQQQET